MNKAMASSRRMLSTLNQEEVQKFQSIAADWWNPNGPAMGLHSMNMLRVPLVTDGLTKTGKTKPTDQPLEGLKIADIGCGGGILSEALARLGADVVGLDPAENNIKIAKSHAELDETIVKKVNYLNLTAEEYLEKHFESPFDAVVASEVIEHVDNPQEFVQTCSNLVPSGGSLFFTTINRSTRSWLGAIIAAENILGLLPRGTHDWNKFIKPHELSEFVENSGCHVRLTHGMFYFPVLNKWTWFPDDSINYALHAIKI